MLPDPNDVPAESFQRTIDSLIAREIIPQFLAPDYAVCPRCLIMRRASVPEAAVDKDNRPQSGQHHIRPAWQVAAKRVSKPSPPKRLSKANLRDRICPANARHTKATLRLRQNICHANLRGYSRFRHSGGSAKSAETWHHPTAGLTGHAEILCGRLTSFAEQVSAALARELPESRSLVE